MDAAPPRPESNGQVAIVRCIARDRAGFVLTDPTSTADPYGPVGNSGSTPIVLAGDRDELLRNVNARVEIRGTLAGPVDYRDGAAQQLQIASMRQLVSSCDKGTTTYLTNGGAARGWPGQTLRFAQRGVFPIASRRRRGRVVNTGVLIMRDVEGRL